MVLEIVFPPSLVHTAASVVVLISMAILGILETRGTHLKYSKFFDASSTISPNVPSRIGMILGYTPPFLVGLASFRLFQYGDFRFLLLKSAITIHFFKRILEVSFIHKFSGEMALDTMIMVLFNYFFLSSSLIYTQTLNQGLPEPSIDFKCCGVVLFLMGIGGNFYHHYLLSKLRTKGGKDYKIPKGVTLGIVLYVMGRSYVTRRWYISKFDDFPKEVKALIPYVF
ncbi:hypothetical protein V6N12_072596 [Hibiscus sabdariffa]|uniref:3-oxo-5-alpha-steroid 4-dehydrogenase C-terminal domain-containing protein n=1 Tax=Hibiscus sabdariffa TaxID=183260 RepID=A0ABR1Z6W8_9ROSI